MPKHSARQKQKQTQKERERKGERDSKAEVRQGGNSNRFGVIRLK